MAKIKSEPKTQIDRTRAVYPRYADLLEKHAELLARAEELQREIGGNVTTWHSTVRDGNIVAMEYVESLGAEAIRHRTWTSEVPRPKPRPVVRHAGAVSLVGDLLSPQPEHETNPPPFPPEWPRQDRYREIGAELGSIAEALKLIGPEIEKARHDYSKQVAAARIGDYSELVERAVDAAKALGNALLEIHAFVNQARLDGVERKYLRPINLEAFGDLSEGSPLYELIARSIELKHVGAGKLPRWKLPAPIALLS